MPTDPPHLHIPARLVPGNGAPDIAFHPAPDEGGQSAGHFTDNDTRNLLGLEATTSYRLTGNYSTEEPGSQPIAYEMLSSTPQRPDLVFLAFVPIVAMYDVTRATLTSDNGQPHVNATYLRQIWESFHFTVIAALELAREARISLPVYARRLVPRLRYRLEDSESGIPFPLQLQPWFSPTAIRARLARIIRVTAILQGFCNLVERLLRPDTRWRYGNPIGLRVSSDIENDAVFQAWARMGVIPSPLSVNVDNDMTSNQLRELLFPVEVEPIIDFEHANEFTGLDDDALNFAMLHPGYHRADFRKNGRATNKRERKRRSNGEYSSDDGEPNDSDLDVTMSHGGGDGNDPNDGPGQPPVSNQQRAQAEVQGWFDQSASAAASSSTSANAPSYPPPQSYQPSQSYPPSNMYSDYETRPSGRSNYWANSRGRGHNSVSNYNAPRPRYSRSRRNRRSQSPSYDPVLSPPSSSRSRPPPTGRPIHAQVGTVTLHSRRTNEIRQQTVFQVSDFDVLDGGSDNVSSAFTPASSSRNASPGPSRYDRDYHNGSNSWRQNQGYRNRDYHHRDQGYQQFERYSDYNRSGPSRDYHHPPSPRALPPARPSSSSQNASSNAQVLGTTGNTSVTEVNATTAGTTASAAVWGASTPIPAYGVLLTPAPIAPSLPSEPVAPVGTALGLNIDPVSTPGAAAASIAALTYAPAAEVDDAVGFSADDDDDNVAASLSPAAASSAFPPSDKMQSSP